MCSIDPIIILSLCVCVCVCVKHASNTVFLRLLRPFFFYMFAFVVLSLMIRQVNDCTGKKIILQLCLCEILGSHHGVADVM